MKKVFLNLKTSDKISFLFTFYNFLSLLILLISVNIIYFFAWYSDQKKDSVYDMDMNYNLYIWEQNNTNLEAFRKYILQKDTIIIPKSWWEMLCSTWVLNKVHDDLNDIKDNLFYRQDWKTYFIFSQYYDDIWEVKVFFDTTPYVKSQVLIIKISFIVIIISLFLNFLIWRKIAYKSLKNLSSISKKLQWLDIEKDFIKIDIIWNKDDEINILSDTINKSFLHIKEQTKNLKQFMTDVSHEFKTPIMEINSKIDLFNKKNEKSNLKQEDYLELLKYIKAKTFKLNRLLDTFLYLSRVENNIEAIQKKEVSLKNYLEKVVLEYFELKESNPKIVFNFKKDKKLFLEESSFRVLLENILSNSLKFSNWDLEIEVWFDEKSMWIKDNWIWIEKEKLDSIWDKFYRADYNKDWFWVGLFIVKRIAKIHSFDLIVDSIVWKGTKFSIYF